MGFLSKLSGHIKELNRMSIAVGNAIVFLDRYDQDGDFTTLSIAGWLCKSIQDIMETGNMSPMYAINVVINRRVQKMTVMDAYKRSVGRFSMIAGEYDGQDKEDLLNMLHGGRLFEEVESIMTLEQKSKLLKSNVTY